MSRRHTRTVEFEPERWIVFKLKAGSGPIHLDFEGGPHVVLKNAGDGWSDRFPEPRTGLLWYDPAEANPQELILEQLAIVESDKVDD